MRPRGAGTSRTFPGSPFNQPLADAAANYSVTDRVSHDRYDLGTVVGIEDDGVSVLVDFGPKVVRIASPSPKMVQL